MSYRTKFIGILWSYKLLYYQQAIWWVWESVKYFLHRSLWLAKIYSIIITALGTLCWFSRSFFYFSIYSQISLSLFWNIKVCLKWSEKGFTLTDNKNINIIVVMIKKKCFVCIILINMYFFIKSWDFYVFLFELSSPLFSVF